MRYTKDGTIIVTDDWKGKGKVSMPARFKPNAVAESVYHHVRRIDRMIYDGQGKRTQGYFTGGKEMTVKQFHNLMIATEPLLTFRDEDYQICTVNGKYMAGPAYDESHDEFFDTVDDMLQNWTLNGVKLIDALPEITY